MLEGKLICVTGAAQGAGREIALLCLKYGATVVGVDVKDKIEARDKLHSLTADISREDDVARVFSRVEKIGELSGLVNAAAVIKGDRLDNTSMPDWNRQIAINLTGPFLMMKGAIKLLLKSGRGGSIVNVGSISSTVGLPEQSAYAASKGGLLQLTRQAAVDYGARGIRCNVVSPGSMRTPMLEEWLMQVSDRASMEKTIASSHPIGRIAQAQEVAEVVAFCLSDRASFVTGANIAVDGGYTAA